MAIELVTGSYREHDEAVALRVSIYTLSIVQYGSRIGQSSLPLEHSLEIVVGFGQILADITLLVISIGREERSLGQGQERW